MTYDLGFLGGGQLARMSIQAAQKMGLRCLSLDPGSNSPASQIARSVVGALDDPEALALVLSQCERVTLENEFIPAHALRQALGRSGRTENVIVPGIETLAVIQDKLLQRRALQKASVPSPHAVELTGDGEEALTEIGFPVVLKARFGGYDGKGTRYVRNKEEWERHRALWAGGGWLAESFVPFKRELAVMVVVDEGKEACFPTMETVQKDHVCDLVFPCLSSGAKVALAAVRAVEGKGLFGVELFETEAGEILVNEIAPRPHNSGHYTLDWGGPSQFEAHVRVALGQAPVTPISASFAVMANLLGQPNARDFRSGIKAALEVEGAHIHWYGKEEAKPGRKMGHLNVAALPHEPVSGALERAVEARERFYAAWQGV